MRHLILTAALALATYCSYAQAPLKPDFDQAVMSLQSEDFTKAESVFTSLLSRATDSGLKKFCYIYRAFSYNGLKQYAKAIADLDKAIELDPLDLASYNDRGKAKGYARDLEGARKDFLWVLAKDSTGEQGQAALYYLGKIAYQQQQFEQSLLYYDRYIALMPDDPEIYFNRGVIRSMLLDPAGAIKEYDKAIELEPDYREAYANRGVSKINLLRKNGPVSLRAGHGCLCRPEKGKAAGRQHSGRYALCSLRAEISRSQPWRPHASYLYAAMDHRFSLRTFIYR